MSHIEIKTVNSNKDLMNFIKLQWKIYANDPQWVPPLISDRKKLLDKKKNPFFQHSEMEMFLAYKDSELVGRIAAITNENHNKFQNDNVGFYGFYECIDDQKVNDTLFKTAEDWLKAKGKDKMLGPMNPSTNDEAGLLIEGFDTPPYVLMCHNPAYYAKLHDNYGLVKAKDLLAWHLDIRGMELPEKIKRVVEASTKKYGLEIRNIHLKKLKKELQLIREIYNDAWSRNWGFVPLTFDEIDHLAADLKQIVREEFVLMVEKEGRPIGFLLTLPNINEILTQIPNGKLLPTGIFKLLTGLKKIKTVRVVTLGVVKDYQHIGLGTILYTEIIKRAQAQGIIGGEMSWILEDNDAMNRPIQLLGSNKYKTYRVYEKNL
ncbi:MAG: GNAT family N-acetyltransferase [Calditrichales bacterium]|nr:MAG: GNAT family N-acetyltransferase [Calditrichales bacterium]